MATKVLISPVYIYHCQRCGHVWHAEFAAGFGGPHCSECFIQDAEIIAKNYDDGEIRVA